MSLIVSIDGPAGTGKSTVSAQVARRLGLPHLDTGAFYRAATLLAMRAGVDIHDGFALARAVENSVLDQAQGVMYLDGEDITGEIRHPRITHSVSVVAAHPGVRRILVGMQRKWVESHGGSAVVEGRDIGSVVFPDAPVKIYLDASSAVRATRRSEQTGQELQSVLGEQEERDQFDSTREASPLVVSAGSTVIDTTDLDVEDVVEAIVAMVPTGSR